MSKHQGIHRYRLAAAAIKTLIGMTALIILMAALLPFWIITRNIGWARGLRTQYRAFTYKRMARAEAHLRVIGLRMRNHQARAA